MRRYRKLSSCADPTIIRRGLRQVAGGQEYGQQEGKAVLTSDVREG